MFRRVDIAKAYIKATNVINAEVKRIFAAFQAHNGLSEAEARRLLKHAPDKITANSLKKLVSKIADPEKRAELAVVLESPAYAWRIGRLEALQENVDKWTDTLAEREQNSATAHYTNLTKDAYARTVFDIQKGVDFAFQFSDIPHSRIKQILRQNWSGVMFSKRIWGNSKDLNQKIMRELLAGFLTGRSYRKTAKAIEEEMAVRTFEARRLVRTESTYIANQAELEGYKECGIDKYRFLATLDMRTSEMCAAMDGKVFKVSEAETGKNLPPLHPWCRSSTVPEIDGNAEQGMKTRAARDPKTGKPYTVPADMTYSEWKKSVNDKYGTGTWENERKKAINAGSDKKQFEKYKSIVGSKNIPKSFDKYQDLKYNNSEGWNKLMRNKRLFEKIDNTESYSAEYKAKLKETYQYFKDNGYEFTMHGLGRVVGQKKSKGKRTFTNEEALEILKKRPNYIQGDGQTIKFYDGIAVVQAADTDEVISVVTKDKIRPDWKELKE